MDFKKECGITYIKAIPQGFICYLSFTGQQYKINYRIHTDAIKSHLIPEKVTPTQANIIYAEEADVLNVAMFGMTARQWRESNPDLKGNIRDYASVNELICLSNMENINAVLINDDIPQGERLVRLNQIAIHQMQILERNSNRNLLR